MAYKSNREMRAEYLSNELRNRERNRAAYERRKNKKSTGVNWLVVVVLLVIALYFVKQRGGMSSLGHPVMTPVASHSR